MRTRNLSRFSAILLAVLLAVGMMSSAVSAAESMELQAAKYTLTVVNGTCINADGQEVTTARFEAGDVITLGMDEVPDGMKFKGWTVKGPGSVDEPGSPDASFIMGNGDATVTAVFEESVKPMPFVDVSADDWFRSYVDFVFQREIMTGVDPTHFAPGDAIPRAQFAVILHRMNSAPKVKYTDKFPDVGDGIWYTDAILWANSVGVVGGYNNGYFGPADMITREQMAVMMYRYANYKHYDVSKKADFSKYQDAASVSEFARDAMRWAVGNEIITGKDGGTKLDPQGAAARAECAAIIMRFINKIEK